MKSNKAFAGDESIRREKAASQRPITYHFPGAGLALSQAVEDVEPRNVGYSCRVIFALMMMVVTMVATSAAFAIPCPNPVFLPAQRLSVAALDCDNARRTRTRGEFALCAGLQSSLSIDGIIHQLWKIRYQWEDDRERERPACRNAARRKQPGMTRPCLKHILLVD